MSSRRNQRRAKQVRRTNVRAARHAQQPPTPEQIALRIVREYAEPLNSRDPVDAEAIASFLMATGYEQLLALDPELQAEAPHPALPVISLLRNLRLEPGELLDATLALAIALRDSDREDPQVAAAGAVLVELLRGSGATDPEWADSIGRYELGTLVDIRDAWGDHHQLLLEFRDASGRTHGLSVEIDATDDFQVQDIEVLEDIGGFIEEMRTKVAEDEDADLLQLVELSPARVGDLLQAGIESTWESSGEAIAENDAIPLFGLLLARAGLFAEALEAASDTELHDAAFDSELDALDHDALLARLVASPERAAETEATDAALAEVVAFAIENRELYRSRFAPSDVAMFLLDHMAEHEDVQLRGEVAALLAAARAWAMFSAETLGLPDALRQDVRRAISYYGVQYAQEIGALPAGALD
ncbi:MAG: hypothetical protein JWM86_2961 [Thermoleophilia bacterium]|nr:hypothetical protein [Thermoleophilia bacterium]